MQFLYPTSRMFPVDEVCEKIVRELEKRDWNVPDINVEFYSYMATFKKWTQSQVQTSNFGFVEFNISLTTNTMTRRRLQS